MVLHRPASSHPSLRVAGFAAAFSLALVTGTALLIGVFGSIGDGGGASVDGVRMTVSEMTMQQTAQRAVQQPEMLLAARNQQNDKRGL